MSDFKGFEWPDDPDVVTILAELLMAQLLEKGRDKYPGAAEICALLASGEVVFTMPEAEQIWYGGLGNFIKTDRNPDKGIGIISMRMKFGVWQSKLLLEHLGSLRVASRKALESAEARDHNVVKALRFVESRVKLSAEEIVTESLPVTR